jgi:hypothetical protein
MPTPNPTQIGKERIAAYPRILTLFASAADMARELALDHRATVGNWKTRGVPLEYILILDALDLIRKETLVPSIRNWDSLQSKHAQRIDNCLKAILKTKAIEASAQTALQSALSPAIREEVIKHLIDLGIDVVPDEVEDVDSIL